MQDSDAGAPAGVVAIGTLIRATIMLGN